MTGLPLLLNLAAYSAQVACIVAVGGLASALLRIEVPSVRYVYWRVVLVVSLALPWLQGRTAAPLADASATIGSVTAVTGPASAIPASAGALALSSWPRLVLTLIVLGAALRLVWIAAGFLRLRRLRDEGVPLELSGTDDTLRRTLAPGAAVREVRGLRQPVTFGWRQPVVLIPDTLRDHDPALREAVLCHEFLHIERRDWASVLLEQVVTSAFWFHPVIWWLVARVQLSREEVVDDLVVRTTGARRTYIEALMVFAHETSNVPAAPFARRRHLFTRIQLDTAKEHVMSRTRLALSSSLLAAVTLAAIWYSSQLFPLSAASPQQVTQTPGPVERAAVPISPENPIPRRTSAVAPRYPGEVTTGDTAAAVNVKLTIDASGRVAEVRAVSISVSSQTPGLTFAVGRDPLQPTLAQIPQLMPNAHPQLLDTAQAFIREATDAVAQWSYDAPLSGPMSFYAQVLFGPGTPVAAASQSASNPGLPQPAPGGGFWSAGPPAFAPQPPAAPQGQSATAAAGRTTSRGSNANAGGAAGTQTPSFVPPPPPPPPPPPSRVDASTVFLTPPIRIGGNIMAPKKLKDVKPVYPSIALSARVSGVVIIEATIDPTGHVAAAKILRSIALLDQAAIDAVRQWQFTPTLLNGQPTPIVMSVTVNFVLTPPEPQ